jgi:hypothetical protein
MTFASSVILAGRALKLAFRGVAGVRELIEAAGGQDLSLTFDQTCSIGLKSGASRRSHVVSAASMVKICHPLAA